MEAETKDYLKWLVKTFKSRKYINEQIKIFECKNNIKHRIEAYFNPLENKNVVLETSRKQKAIQHNTTCHYRRAKGNTSKALL